jgi:hypothetical protein
VHIYRTTRLYIAECRHAETFPRTLHVSTVTQIFFDRQAAIHKRLGSTERQSVGVQVVRLSDPVGSSGATRSAITMVAVVSAIDTCYT